MKLEIERVFKSSCEELYSFWTDPIKVSSWFGVKVEVDSKVGGKITIDFGEEDLTRGTYKELQPFNKVVFTWNSFNEGQPTGETLVSVFIEKIDDSTSRMKLVHSNFQSELAKNEHLEGWTEYYNNWEKKFA